MCGVVGIVSQTEVSPLIYDALTILQHRGHVLYVAVWLMHHK